jgi:hypothetical protein
MMSSKNNGFTASDIERYHSGKMSPQERHALEKAALDDPFLADALEGYAFTSTPTADVAKIQSRLNEKLDQKKVIPIFQRYRWLSVAALFIIIAGTGWLVYNISEKGNQPSVAIQKEKESVEDSNYVMPGQQTSIDSGTSITTSIDKKINKKQQSNTSTENKTPINSGLANEQIPEGLVVSNAVSNQSNAYYKKESNLNSERRLSAPQNQIGGNNGRFNNIQRVDISRNNNASTVQRENDIASNNVSRTEGYNYNTAGQPAARVRAMQQDDTVKHFDIVLRPLPKDSQPAMQEVVVGYGAQKKSIDKYPKVTIDTLEPDEGYVKFDDYVINNLKMPEELRTKTLSGEVQLAFDVDQNGQPVNITVVKSLCEKCDEEAIRLLKEGPKWKKKKDKKGKITIKF